MTANSIDPRMIQSLLQLQLMNSMNLITSGGEADSSNGDAGGIDFASLLQSFLNPDASSQDTSPLAALGGMSSQPFSLSALAGLPLSSSALSNLSPQSASGPVPARMPLRAGSFSPDPLAGKPSSFDPLIGQASAMFGVDPSLVKAVIHQESSFNPYAVSSAGAKGLMQLMDDTGSGLGVSDPYDPQQNVQAGTEFLAGLLSKYNGNEAVALAAYNAGPGRIDRLGIRNDQDLASKLHLLPQETQQYVKRVLDLKQQYGA